MLSFSFVIKLKGIEIVVVVKNILFKPADITENAEKAEDKIED
jgi:hypothetical protein